MGNVRIEHWPSIGYAITAVAESHCIDFKVFTYYPESGGGHLYQRRDAVSSPDPTPDINDAEVYLSGSVKWDGCSNFTFDEQERCMLHTCSRADMVQIGTLLAYVHDMAMEMLDTADWTPETTREQREEVPRD